MITNDVVKGHHQFNTLTSRRDWRRARGPRMKYRLKTKVGKYKWIRGANVWSVPNYTLLYLGNSRLLGSPQTAWSSRNVSISVVQSPLSHHGAFFYTFSKHCPLLVAGLNECNQLKIAGKILVGSQLWWSWRRNGTSITNDGEDRGGTGICTIQMTCSLASL